MESVLASDCQAFLLRASHLLAAWQTDSPKRLGERSCKPAAFESHQGREEQLKLGVESPRASPQTARAREGRERLRKWELAYQTAQYFVHDEPIPAPPMIVHARRTRCCVLGIR